jgi:hypothetical protein
VATARTAGALHHRRRPAPLTNPAQAYHSVFLDEPNQLQLGNVALLPLRTRTRGPAMQLPPLKPGESERDVDASHESYDPLDEVLELFRANTFFRNFEIKGPADRLLIYGILFVQEILGKIKSSTFTCGCWDGENADGVRHGEAGCGEGGYECRARYKLCDSWRCRVPAQPGV